MNKLDIRKQLLHLTILTMIASLSFSLTMCAVSAAPAVTITSPKGGETWNAGSIEEITYSTTGSGIAQVRLEYSIDSGKTWSTIPVQPVTGNYSWIVPDSPSTECLIRATIVDSNNKVLAQDTGTKPFSIVKPRILIPKIPLPPLKKLPPLKQTLSAEAQSAINGAVNQLKGVISNSLSDMQQDLPRNPNLSAQYKTKIALLQDPDLYETIVKGNFFAVDFVSSIDKRGIPIVATFPTADMYTEASNAVQIIKMSLPVVEDFMSVPYARDRFYIWYGFSIGNTGGAGVINMEDQTTYEARLKPPMVPYEPILCHELSHAYIGHEGLNQFLEIYTYNMITVRSASFGDWTYLRDYQNWQGTKTGYAALLDIYRLIGLVPMKNAYRIIYTNKPPYGQPLDSKCKQAFIDQAPSALKAQVSAIVSNITY